MIVYKVIDIEGYTYQVKKTKTGNIVVYTKNV